MDQPLHVRAYGPVVKTLAAVHRPSKLVLTAARNTQLAPSNGIEAPNMPKEGIVRAIFSILSMGHTSVLEHASVTFKIENASRGCVDQLVRHRIGSFTASSTHYNAHSQATALVPKRLLSSGQACSALIEGYKEYLEQREKIGAEARQLMPLALETRIIWTVNARALLNFLQLRLCNRNMLEMRMLANAVYSQACAWFPEVFETKYALPPCALNNCTQGSMRCKEGLYELQGDY